MYYQVSYYDVRSKKQVRSSLIHTSKKAAVAEMDRKIKLAHTKNVVVLSGSKLSK